MLAADSWQLTAGYSVTLRDYGLATYMPDFNDLGGAKGRLTPRKP